MGQEKKSSYGFQHLGIPCIPGAHLHIGAQLLCPGFLLAEVTGIDDKQRLMDFEYGFEAWVPGSLWKSYDLK